MNLEAITTTSDDVVVMQNNEQKLFVCRRSSARGSDGARVILGEVGEGLICSQFMDNKFTIE